MLRMDTPGADRRARLPLCYVPSRVRFPHLLCSKLERRGLSIKLRHCHPGLYSVPTSPGISCANHLGAAVPLPLRSLFTEPDFIYSHMAFGGPVRQRRQAPPGGAAEQQQGANLLAAGDLQARQRKLQTMLPRWNPQHTEASPHVAGFPIVLAK